MTTKRQLLIIFTSLSLLSCTRAGLNNPSGIGPLVSGANRFCSKNSPGSLRTGMAGGKGTKTKPYWICNPKQYLNFIRMLKAYKGPMLYFSIVQNLDLGGQMIEPVRSESAFSLQGNHHLISNFVIDQQRSDYVGLISILPSGSRVANLNIENASITGANNVGGLAGAVEEGANLERVAIRNSSILGQIGVGGITGGLGGFMLKGHADNISVNGTDWVGGVIGSLTSTGTAFQVAAVVTTVHASDPDAGVAGGVIGKMHSASTVTDFEAQDAMVFASVSGKAIGEMSRMTSAMFGLASHVQTSPLSPRSAIGRIEGYGSETPAPPQIGLVCINHYEGPAEGLNPRHCLTATRPELTTPSFFVNLGFLTEKWVMMESVFGLAFRREGAY